MMRLLEYPHFTSGDTLAKTIDPARGLGSVAIFAPDQFLGTIRLISLFSKRRVFVLVSDSLCVPGREQLDTRRIEERRRPTKEKRFIAIKTLEKNMKSNTCSCKKHTHG
jgi:hypothetical protein